jgi:hypothetical protein
VVAPAVLRARGRALLGPLRYVKERYGKGELEALTRGAPPELSGVLAQRVAQGAWYPYGAYVALLRGIDRRFGRGDLTYCRELGEWAGRQDLGSMFKIYAMLASPERLIRACKLVWPQYYDMGEMFAVSAAAHDTRLRITGAPEMDPAHCRLMEGWMVGTMAQIGCRVHAGAGEVVCPSRGGDHHEFACTWEAMAKAGSG